MYKGTLLKDDFLRSALKSLAIILALLLLDLLPIQAWHLPKPFGRVGFAIGQMHNGLLNAEDYHALAANYYEGIEHVDRIAKDNVENAEYLLRDDFLRFEYRPGISRQYEAGLRMTNSFGMQNPEYPLRKPAHVRRIALLGDSISLGPSGHDYIALLESSLNRDALTPGVTQGYQLLNFSVPGYILLQEMDVALEKAPKFQPDVYVVALTSQEIAGSSKHIGRLVVKGTDLKYDFLRRMTAEAGVRSTDSRDAVMLKLKPFFNPMTRWALAQIRDHAAAEGAKMIIVLVPAPISVSVTASDFDTLHAAVDGLGVPVIDLRDTFRSIDLHSVQVIPEADIHPNVLGHRMIFDNLYAHLREQPEAWSMITGNGAFTPSQSPPR